MITNMVARKSIMAGEFRHVNFNSYPHIGLENIYLHSDIFLTLFLKGPKK